VQKRIRISEIRNFGSFFVAKNVFDTTSCGFGKMRQKYGKILDFETLLGYYGYIVVESGAFLPLGGAKWWISGQISG
jgi:hypothetical protein